MDDRETIDSLRTRVEELLLENARLERERDHFKRKSIESATRMVVAEMNLEKYKEAYRKVLDASHNMMKIIRRAM